MRRTSRKSMPNSVLMMRRQMIRENFLKTPESTKKSRKVACKSGKKIVNVQKRIREVKLKTENGVGMETEQKPVLHDYDSSPKKEKREKEESEERFDIPENFGRFTNI